MFGGGQERGWRPGTQPVHLIAGLGRAAELALEECSERKRVCTEFRGRLLSGLEPLQPIINGDPTRSAPHIMNFAIPGLDSETVIEAWQDIVAISNGAACTSQSYTCSHVLSAMGLPRSQQDGALRLSWCHRTPLPDFRSMIDILEDARRRHSL
jgi:cysteine desulfurase